MIRIFRRCKYSDILINHFENDALAEKYDAKQKEDIIDFSLAEAKKYQLRQRCNIFNLSLYIFFFSPEKYCSEDCSWMHDILKREDLNESLKCKFIEDHIDAQEEN